MEQGYLFQNVTKENEDQINSHDVNNELRLSQEYGQVTDLPHEYTNITPTKLKDGTFYVPECLGSVTSDCDSFTQQTCLIVAILKKPKPISKIGSDMNL